jgi:hypothetical protein
MIREARHHTGRDRRITFPGRRGDSVEQGGTYSTARGPGPPPATTPLLWSTAGAPAGRHRRYRPAEPRSPAARTPPARRVPAAAPGVPPRFDVPARPIRRQQHSHFRAPAPQVLASWPPIMRRGSRGLGGRPRLPNTLQDRGGRDGAGDALCRSRRRLSMKIRTAFGHAAANTAEYSENTVDTV